MIRICSGILLFVSLTGATAAFAQQDKNWNQSHDPYVAAFGLAAGASSGTGIAIRWPALPQTMATLAGGVWGATESLDWNLGLEAHYVLRQVASTRLFVGPAAAIYSNNDEDEYNVNVSLNIGVEYLLAPRFAIKGDIGFTYLSDNEKIYPLPQVALFYYF
jgi:hypothetical protein